MELLDGVCESMKDYELRSIATDLTDQAETWQWVHPKHTQQRPLQNNTLDKAQLKQQQRRLQNYCAQLLDKYEEKMSAALQKGSSAKGDGATLCVCKHCLVPELALVHGAPPERHRFASITGETGLCSDTDLDQLLCTELSADCQKLNTQKTRHTEL